MRIPREQILDHALKTVRARTLSKVWACFEQRLLRNRPAAAMPAEWKLEPYTVSFYASRILKQVHSCCEEFDEDISHGFESDVSRRC